MKKIDAVIRQESLGDVRDRLTSIGVEGLTVTEVASGNAAAVGSTAACGSNSYCSRSAGRPANPLLRR